ncbi:acyltransferase family protein [Bacillus sp. FJAT-44742]|uniref:acyltransferase family protein n=1 Tax=Bacillus sp. FJAT-44742 TaxID=2014005 RepID=UPI000C24F5D5|nr:acyltransferase family protein [Bacillus sp. FJAT-44742]
MEKKIINEIYWVRAIACLAVVVIHSVNITLTNYEHTVAQFEEYFLIAVRFAAFFGTPAFVFISELLLARSYPNKVPHGFFLKRVKYLLFPFVFMGLVFAFITTDSLSGFIRESLFNVFLGGYTGYFILIIFQFYILHVFLHKFLKNWSPVKVILVSLIINVVYLSFFNFTEPLAIPLGDYIWQRGHWLPFVGWIFYFVLGYYCGKNYESLKELVIKYKKIIILFPMINLIIMFVLVRSDILPVVSSKRIDNLFYTSSVIGAIIFFSLYVKKVPHFILLISKYSFNIYLLHTFFLFYLPPIDFLNPLVYFIFAVAFSMFCSYTVAKLASPFQITQFLIGKPIPIPKQTKTQNSRG